MPKTIIAQPASARPRPAREIGLLVLLYVGYSAARFVADPDLGAATGNARHLLGLEAALGLDVEQWTNAALTALPGAALLASYWYALLHYAVTPAVLLWVYRRRPARYRLVRTALVAGSALGVIGFVLVPMAPPRMLPGYVDVLAATAEHGWWGADASAPRGLASLTNELAAMPSLHVGWAVWCAWVVFLCTRRVGARVAAVSYVVGTTAVVMTTANHYLLDAVAGAAVIAVGAVAATSWERGRKGRAVPPVGFEPTHPAPEADALSPELRGLGQGERLPVARSGATRANCPRERVGAG